MDPSTWRQIFMAKVQTSVMVDKDKRDLAKQKGLKLQDILDNALNVILELEVKGKAQLEIDQNDILKNIEFKELEIKEYLEKYQQKIDQLEMQKTMFIDKKEHEIKELKTQLNMINSKLDKAIEEQSHLNKLNEYKEIIRIAGRKGFMESDEPLLLWIGKWRVMDTTAMFKQANQDLTSVYYGKLKVDDITIDAPAFKGIEDDGGNK